MQSGEARPSNTMDVHAATRLMRDILDITGEFEAHVARHLTVNATDLEAMEELIKDGPLSPSELSRRLGITTAAVTTVVDRLEALGHASRIPNPSDRRGVIVVPAPASVDKAMKAIMPAILGINRVIDEFTDAERATIVSYLEQVAEIYRQQLPS